MKKTISLMLILSVLFISGCDIVSDNTKKVDSIDTTSKNGIGDDGANSVMDVDRNSYGREAVRTEQNQNHLNQDQPAEKLDWSLERENLNQRLKRWNDPNKISYIYLLSNDGKVLSYFTIKGKVSSVNSKLTTTNQLINYDDYNDDPYGVVESPDMDGSYGSNGNAVFFFLTDGTYMEWPGLYLLSDNPIKLTQKPIMIYDLNKEDKK